jgi:3-deoxy-D-manno-octulosonic-acid transferase
MARPKTKRNKLSASNSPEVKMMTAWFIYNGIMIIGTLLSLPILTAAVLASAKRRENFRQRLGWWSYPWERLLNRKGCPTIWVHALSVGEVLAAEPLVKRLALQMPSKHIVFSTSTNTGFQTAQKVFTETDLALAFFPFDFLWSVRRVVRKIKPSLVILVETDLWPNFMSEMWRLNIPLYIVNLRLSQSSWVRFKRFKGFVAPLLNLAKQICTQTESDARQLSGLGVARQHIVVTGNLKFDAISSAVNSNNESSWRTRLNLTKRHRVVVAGSTHTGEDDMVVAAMEKMQDASMPTLLILVPRDPRRSPEVVRICRQRSLRAVRLSQIGPDGHSPLDVVVVDKIGYLRQLYAVGDIAVIGGSFVPRGGHNPLEPAALGKPVIFGSDMSDFKHIAALLLDGGAARQIQNAENLKSVLSELLNDPLICERMGSNALRVFQSHHGAVDRTLACLGFVES